MRFAHRYVISSHTLLNMWLFIHAGIKVNLWKARRGCNISWYHSHIIFYTHMVAVLCPVSTFIYEIELSFPYNMYQHFRCYISYKLAFLGTAPVMWMAMVLLLLISSEIKPISIEEESSFPVPMYLQCLMMIGGYFPRCFATREINAERKTLESTEKVIQSSLCIILT